MDFSFKQCAAVVLAAIVFSFALQTLWKQLPTQGEAAHAKTITTYVNFNQILNAQNIVVKQQFKPTAKATIVHMRKGNYEAFSYQSLLQVLDFTGTQINNFQEANIDGKINGQEAGANILYCTVYDAKGNYLRYKIAVIIEGNQNINTMIETFDEGKLL